MYILEIMLLKEEKRLGVCCRGCVCVSCGGCEWLEAVWLVCFCALHRPASQLTAGAREVSIGPLLCVLTW